MKKLMVVSTALGLFALASAAQAQDPAKLAQDKACLACHHVDKKLVGPAYKAIAAKYRNDKNAMATLAK